MSTGSIIFGVVAVFAVALITLNRLGARTYRPTSAEMAGALRSLIAGEMTWERLDELSSVRITYDKQLENIRQRIGGSLDQPGAFDSTRSNTSTVKLSEAGRSRIGGIIRELEGLTT